MPAAPESERRNRLCSRREGQRRGLRPPSTVLVLIHNAVLICPVSSRSLCQKTVRAAKPGFLEHLCVRYIGSTIMTDAVSHQVKRFGGLTPPRAFSEHSESRRYNSSGKQIGSVERTFTSTKKQRRVDG